MGKKRSKKFKQEKIIIPKEFYDYKCRVTVKMQKNWLFFLSLLNFSSFPILQAIYAENLIQSLCFGLCKAIPVIFFSIYFFIYKKGSRWCNLFANITYFLLVGSILTEYYMAHTISKQPVIDIVYINYLFLAYIGIALAYKVKFLWIWLTLLIAGNTGVMFFTFYTAPFKFIIITLLTGFFVECILSAFEKILLHIYIENIEAEKKNYLDALTRLYTRRGTKYFAKDNKFDQNGSIAIFDIDFFKKVNDKYGHDKGDEVLRYFADMIKKYKSFNDVAIRWGGEEVVLFMPDTNAEAAYKKADNIRMKIKQGLGSPIPISVSGGVTAVTKGEDLEAAVKRADVGLYYSKEHGRNQVKLVVNSAEKKRETEKKSC